MGAPAGAGGSDKSDEKKVDTYSDQLKKIQKRKSKTKKDKFGYTVKKSIFERIGDKHPVIQGVKNVSDKMNLNRRMKFAIKVGVNLQGLSTEEILSDNFKSKLEAKGYKTSSNANIGGDNNRDRDSANQVVQDPLVATTMPVGTPTEVEISQSEAANADDIYTRRKKSKARGRSMMTLTSSKGVTDNKLTLGKPSLLGS